MGQIARDYEGMRNMQAPNFAGMQNQVTSALTISNLQSSLAAQLDAAANICDTADAILETLTGRTIGRGIGPGPEVKPPDGHLALLDSHLRALGTRLSTTAEILMQIRQVVS
jgi:hypothetical protein